MERDMTCSTSVKTFLAGSAKLPRGEGRGITSSRSNDRAFATLQNQLSDTPIHKHCCFSH